MDRKAIDKAESRLRVAKKAAGDLHACKDYRTFVDTWYTFITASKNIWTVLEQGAKDNAQCRQWFGTKANYRRADELLQYLFEARNDDEHGLDAITEHVPGTLKVGVNKPGFSNAMHIKNLVIDGEGQISFETESLDGKPILVEQTPSYARLAQIRPRGRPPMHPPTSHLGTALSDNSPVAVADTAVVYLEALVAEARGRPA
jgi:hypothetical protein